MKENSPNAEGEAMVARFALIHDVIRRDLDLVREGLVERIEQRARALDSEPGARALLAAELNELGAYLLAHLDWEEAAIFPTIRRMTPDDG
ncbi:MAG TPA: hemerythrin domain-containing protein [Conexibacter sp.]